jgi:hypothetical protein
LDPHTKFNVKGELINKKIILFECETKLYMLNRGFLTFVGSKINSSNDNPWERWIVLLATS